MPERIAKVIARAGICSRRAAEALIAQGRISLDGRVLDSPAVVVDADAKIEVDGAALPAPQAARLWRLHKPAGVLTTARDPQGRRTIMDLLPAGLPRLMPVGRLDLSSEGLLLLTNDGGLKRRLELPSSGLERRYRVRVFGRIDQARQAALADLADGISIDGVDYGPIKAALDSQRQPGGSGANSWLLVTLMEGKNREVRRICEHLGLRVNRLIRLSYGPFHLGRLARGAIEELPQKAMHDQLGDRPKPRKAGTAKAKPRPVSPGHKARQRRRKGTTGAPGADRRRKA